MPGAVYFKKKFRTKLRPQVNPVPSVTLIDLAFILLLFLIIGSRFTVKPGIRVELPAAPFTSGISSDARVLLIADPEMIFFEDERIMLEHLPAVFARLYHENPDTPVIIEADASIPHDMMLKVYTIALNAGLDNIAVATGVPQTPES